MSFLKNLFSSAASDLVNSVGGIIDGLHVSDEEKAEAKLAIGDRVLNSLDNLASVQGEVIKTEMGGNWLQKSWRPITMLTLVSLLVIRWTGIANFPMPVELESQLMTLIQIGLGGYVASRGIEKTAAVLTANVDMPFLKKKDRKT